MKNQKIKLKKITRKSAFPHVNYLRVAFKPVKILLTSDDSTPDSVYSEKWDNRKNSMWS